MSSQSVLDEIKQKISSEKNADDLLNTVVKDFKIFVNLDGLYQISADILSQVITKVGSLSDDVQKTLEQKINASYPQAEAQKLLSIVKNLPKSSSENSRSDVQSIPKSPSQNSVGGSSQPFDYDWLITDWDKIEKEAISPEFTIDNLNFYMKCTKPSTPTQFLSVKVVLNTAPGGPKTHQFQITLKNTTAGKSVTKMSTKAFGKINAYETYMMAQNKFINGDDGFVDNNTILIHLHHPVSVPKKAPLQPKTQPTQQPQQHYVPREKVPTPPPVLPPQQPEKSSKELTGCVGIRNQGATCYMNSLLQSLFHLPAFRRIVYHMPTTGTEDPSKSIPLCLQRLFCQLQLSEHAGSTIELTKSFGWNQRETMQQQDVQEFCRVLMQTLEYKLSHTDLATAIDNLFRGHTRTYIRCTDVDFKKEIIEDFKDLSLVVKGCKTLRESLQNELAPQDMDSLYETDDFGKQKAVMGTEYMDFPSVLHIHLRRFARDYERNTSVKINDYFEFPAELDLGEFLAKDADHSKSNIYDLYGVLVHSGGSMCGHYYAFLRISQDPQWYKFDDQNVTKVSADEAIKNNYGGMDGTHERSYSGYMLIYVRREDAPVIFEPIPDETVPKHLREYYEYTQTNKGADHGPIEINLTSEDILKSNCQKWITGFMGQSQQAIHLPREKPLSSLYESAAQVLNKDPSKIRIWKCQPYSIPKSIVVPSDQPLSSQFQGGSYAFIQDLSENEKIELDNVQKLTVFMKFFFPGDQPFFHYIGAAYPLPETPLEDPAIQACESVGLPKETPLLCFQETVQKTAVLVSSNNLSEAACGAGAILVWQVVPGTDVPISRIELEKTNKNLDHVSRSSSLNEMSNLQSILYTDVYPESRPITVDQYLERKLHQIRVVLCNVATPNQPSAVVKFPSNLRWNGVKQFIASALKLEYSPQEDSMRLFKRQPGFNLPMKTPINAKLTPSMASLIACEDTSSSLQKETKQEHKEHPWLYFQLFKGIPEASNSTMTNFSVQFSADSVKVDTTSQLLMPSTCPIREIANEMVNRCLMARATNLRALHINYHKILGILDLQEPAPSNFGDSIIRFEVTPIEQTDLKEDEHLVSVVRGYIDKFEMPRLAAEPFLYMINEKDSLKSIKESLLDWAGVLKVQQDACILHIIKDKKIKKDVTDEQPIWPEMKKSSILIIEPSMPRSSSMMRSGNLPLQRKNDSSVRILN
ncbi:Clan CA, family C19, ubiquitin hydrolase-like cysteine peptidase [Trichomonas vaginalis G3]|uniref:ubiquitinyl hydrolase 1 n=1 Tax=Trichomonas vaginalis (strain ATCC PRA-98 / G3) TaxID=412133 RepID=A2EVB1_TRIV3|nr:ubiquitinyl hydrolase protein [Trichomonas vaginalis G3]EAY03425.1 Clan CA, family C19, ubiquitin hydrolase-like cysteine peptidase [Trichomonas vaginalis G3]KAI5498242.1 ubiquitinyl hydrolase protein [Trichomonas vaginalis G3]|eukprot:XP_001315648.1 Clan CA, family C19, ubiquitin hydrolase-like cysteine peptidase [Trichomonas vaginalis G3]